MWFGEIPVPEAEGAILAHGLAIRDVRFKKGRKLSREDVERLRDASLGHVVAVRLDAGDLDEDTAARLLGDVLAGPGVQARAPFTGRVNLHAARRGIFCCPAIDRLNLIDPAITLATRENWAVVETGEMIATLKIIPFAVPGEIVAQAMDTDIKRLSVQPFRRLRTSLIQTILAQTKLSTLDKTRAVLERRLAFLDSTILPDHHCPHRVEAVHEAIGASLARDRPDLILLVGASAIVDARDILPAAIIRAGGVIERFGMPVDPGNLLLLGRIGTVKVIGLPGCARSPKRNGIDLVLARLCAGLEVTPEDIARMGTGGLLIEDSTRLARRSPTQRPRICATAVIILAAGLSRRMGASNKLLAEIEGTPMIRRIARTCLQTNARRVIVVTGHDGDSVVRALDGLAVEHVHNPDFADGASSSIRAGIMAILEDKEIEAALFQLADMPLVPETVFDRMIDGFHLTEWPAIRVPTSQGKWGNPVLFARRLFRELCALEGDVGGKQVMLAHGEEIAEIPVDDLPGALHSVLIDADTPAALATLRDRMAASTGKKGAGQ